MRFLSMTRQSILLGFLLVVGILLAACVKPPPTPTALSTMAAKPEQKPALTPERTEPPGQVALSTAQPFPTVGRTPTPVVAPSAEPDSEPTAAPSYRQQLVVAEREQFNGNYEAAIAAYLSVLEDDPTADEARRAGFGLAESYLLNRDYVAAASAWDEFLTRFPDDARWPVANLMAARAYESVNECAQAIGRYEAYLTRDDTLADLVYDWIGDCHALSGTLAEALSAYQSGLGLAQDPAQQVALYEQIAGVYTALEEYDAAVAEYNSALELVTTDYYRAKVERQIGKLLLAAGRPQESQARYRNTVDKYPRTDSAYQSLTDLVDAGVEVDEFQRGLVDHYADAQGAAIRAFDRYLDKRPAEKADEALYYKALAQQSLGQGESALETLESLIVGYPQSKQVVHAWLVKGETLASLGETEAAIKAYQDLAAFFPADELAPAALWRAAQLREAGAEFNKAADLYQELQADFPNFKEADHALWRAGLSLYRVGEPQRAAIYWKSLLEKYPDSAYRARSLYWLGKLGVKAGPGNEDDYWDQLLASEPNTYYGLRVAQIRAGEPLTAARFNTSAVHPPPWDAGRTGEAILAWLQEWTQVPTTTQQLNVPGGVSQDTNFRRGETLLAAGLRREALVIFDKVRTAAWQDALTLAQLSVLFRDRGVVGLASRCAYRVAWLWPEGTIHEAPVELQRLAYPLVYADLLTAQAQERSLDPLLLAALVRQESLFEPVAESYAGARGLGQVMPATGRGIADSLGVEDFVLDDLYRPSVSIRFGAYYLGVQLQRFDGQILVALAAYNGGPGNAIRWGEAAGDDLDLFVEVITASQSRLYLQRVYEQYHVYERLYRAVQGESQ